MWIGYLARMYGGVEFVLTVTRDFVHNCQTPLLVLPDSVPAGTTLVFKHMGDSHAP